ncbi:hypothetical protein V5O48_006133 [Marasmius crinis-equi]|uniref:Isomerase YbhE n=1 Tax=Marasmius crinis-equi TaxID=585013 RepID=A0ABR3FKK2_9AGAR
MSNLHRILVASYTNDVYTLEFDSSEATVTLKSSLEVGTHPSWLAPHPKDPSLVFTGLEQSDGKIVALKYDENGVGKVVAHASSGGEDPCHLLVKDDELLIANYTSGDFSALPISHEAPYFHSGTPKTIHLTGSGPNTERQKTAHAHGVFWSEGTKELLVPNLGADRVSRLTRGSDGWKVAGDIKFHPGGGPRHVAIYDGMLYTILELTSHVYKHQLLPLPKEPVFLTAVSTLSHPPSGGATAVGMLAAEIVIPETSSAYPTPYVYASNRNDPSPEGDTIVIFEASTSATLALITEVRTGLKHLRGMVFGGPDDRWLIAGGANGGGVRVYERIDGGKGLKLVAQNEKVKAPTGFLWL